MKYFIKNILEFSENITSLSGKVLNPKLKVRLKGIENLDEDNLKESKIDFEFVAELGGD